MNYKEYFKDKNIAVIGLGLYGEMVPDIKFLKNLKSNITIFDTRSKSKIESFIKKLGPKYSDSIKIGKINPDDLIDKDLIILSSDIHSKSLFLKKAKEANVPIEYQEIVFLKFSPNITLIGVAGSYGKTMISKLIYSIFKSDPKSISPQNFYAIDHESGNGYISNLKKIKPGDIVISEIPEYMINEYRNANINPHIAVITSLTSVGNGGENEVFGLLERQTYNNFIIAPDSVIDVLRNRFGFTARAKIFRTRKGLVPANWNISIQYPQYKENASLALQVSEIFKIDRDIAQGVIESFKGVKGHMEFVRSIKGVDYYNDAGSTSPEATRSAIMNLYKDNPNPEDKNIILIIGGAYTGYEYQSLIETIGQSVRLVICLPGSGTVGFRNQLLSLKKVEFKQALDIREALTFAKENSKKGDKVIFSPACIALGVFENRLDRIDKFTKLIKGLK